MRQTWVRRLLPAVFALALATPLHGQSFGFQWWKDAQFQRELTLSADQIAKIDAVFQAAITQLRPKAEELTKQEELLSQQIVAGADETLVIKQIDRVEGIRAHLNKTRTLMLLKERQVLSPEQRVKLNKLHEQWEKDHKRPSGRNDK